LCLEDSTDAKIVSKAINAAVENSIIVGKESFELKLKRTLGELLLLSVLILAFNIGQTECLYPPATEWTRTYGISDNHDEARSLIQTSDGGYAMLGFTQHWETGWSYTSDFWLVKTDPAGNAEWNRTYGAPTSIYLEAGESVVQTDDGGYALAGYAGIYGDPLPYYDFWLVKTDSLGNMQWNRTYGGASGDLAFCVVQTNDGGYAIAGGTDSFGAGGWDFWLVRTDSAGNMMWNQTYGGAGRDVAYSVVQTGDGGYAMAGTGFANFVKTDASGVQQWNRTYGGSLNSIIQTSDAGYALGGNRGGDFWLVKTDSAGNMMWNQTYGGTQTEEEYSMVETSDGGYALLGWTNSFGACDYWLVKTDSTGNMMWNQTYGGSLADIGYAVVQTVDGGYAMAGYSNYYIDIFPYAVIDFWLIKTYPCARILAEVHITPGTLNLKSKGKWITAYIQPPAGYNPEDIDATTILLNETVPPVLDPKYDFVTDPNEYIVDHNGDGVLERMVKFNKTEVASYICNIIGIQYGNVTLAITGEADGTPFEGTDTIKVLFPGDADDDGDVDPHDFYIFSGCYGMNNENPSYNSLADFNEDGYINSEDFYILSGNYGKTAV
jgi:hypothetical protein